MRACHRSAVTRLPEREVARAGVTSVIVSGRVIWVPGKRLNDDKAYPIGHVAWFQEHFILKQLDGRATRSQLVTPVYRNFFPPGRRDIFAGFRTCALSESQVATFSVKRWHRPDRNDTGVPR